MKYKTNYKQKKKEEKERFELFIEGEREYLRGEGEVLNDKWWVVKED